MQVNSAKTKEMIIDPLAKINLPLLTTPLGNIERVSSFKLLRVGLHIESSLSWSTHVNSILKKAMHLQTLLSQTIFKRSNNHLLHDYTSVIRPVLKYSARLALTGN